MKNKTGGAELFNPAPPVLSYAGFKGHRAPGRSNQKPSYIPPLPA